MIKPMKNLSVFNLTEPNNRHMDDYLKIIADKLDHQSIEPPKEFEWSTRGFAKVIPGSENLVEFATGSNLVLRYREYKRNLPASVIRDEMEKEVKRFEKQNGNPPIQAERRELQHMIEVRLLPKSFITHKDTLVFVTERFVIICAVGNTVCDDIISALRLLFDGLPVTPFFKEAHRDSPLNLSFIAKRQDDGDYDQLLKNFDIQLEGDFQLVSPEKTKATGKGENILDGAYQQLLNMGYRVTRLPLYTAFAEDDVTALAASFQLADDGKIRQLSFPQYADLLQDQLGEDDDYITQDRATLYIYCDLILQLLNLIEQDWQIGFHAVDDAEDLL